MMLAFLYLTVVSMIYLLDDAGRMAIHRFILWLLSYRRTHGMYTANLSVRNGLIIYPWSVVEHNLAVIIISNLWVDLDNYGGLPSQMASNVKNVSLAWCHQGWSSSKKGHYSYPLCSLI